MLCVPVTLKTPDICYSAQKISSTMEATSVTVIAPTYDLIKLPTLPTFVVVHEKNHVLWKPLTALSPK